MDYVKLMPDILAVLKSTGIVGLLILIGYIEHRRWQDVISLFQAEIKVERTEQRKNIEKLTEMYAEQFNKLSGYYGRSVSTAEYYEKLSKELAAIISMNTHAQTQLSDKIDNNLFCPIIRRETRPHD